MKSIRCSILCQFGIRVTEDYFSVAVGETGINPRRISPSQDEPLLAPTDPLVYNESVNVFGQIHGHEVLIHEFSITIEQWVSSRPRHTTQMAGFRCLSSSQ